MADPIAYQTDENGVYIGQVPRQPSPLEPGVFLVPGGAVLVEPPVIEEGQKAVWDGEQWVIQTLAGEIVALAKKPKSKKKES